MKNYSKKQFTKLIECSFVFVLFFILFSVSVFSIRVHTCSVSGEYYNDFEEVTSQNWGGYNTINNNSQDYFDISGSAINGFNVTTTIKITPSNSPANYYETIVNENYTYTILKYIVYQKNTSNISQTLYVTNQFVIPNPVGLVLYGDYLYLYSSNSVVANKTLYQLNATNISQIINKIELSGFATSNPYYYNENIYISADNKYLFQFNASNITLQISNFTANSSISNDVIVDNDKLFISMANGYLYQLNANNVSQNQTRVNISFTQQYQTVIYKENIYFFANNRIFKLNESDLTQKTNSSRVYSVLGNPIISNDFLYFTLTNDIYQVNISDLNTIYASYHLNTAGVNYAYFLSSSYVFVVNGFLYTTYNHQVLFPSLSYSNHLLQLQASNISVGISDIQIQTSTNSDCYLNSKIAIFNNFVYMNGYIWQNTDNTRYSTFYITKGLTKCISASFVSPTETNGTSLNRTYININVSATFGTYNITRIDINVYYPNNSVVTYSSNSSPFFVNHTIEINGTYQFNSTVYDTKNNTFKVQNRLVIITFVFPFVITGSCFDKIKNQNESDIDYGGICGQCGNFTFYSDDTSYQVLRESDLYTYPFNQSQCSQGDAVVGSYTFLILLITLGLFIVGGLVLFFFGIPILIFAITGSFKFSWWNLLFGGKKKQKEKEQDSSNDTYSN
jgi:hypothetical protein